MLQLIATRLGSLCEEVVFLGGSTTGLFITDSGAPDVRATFDVDCIVDVISIPKYYMVEQKLQACGFKKGINDNVICRWHMDEMILDVMPTDEKILGFSNKWYKPAIFNAVKRILSDNLQIQIVSPPYLIATKLEAFKNRGMMDYMLSHDLEDIITVIDGRAEIVDEIINADNKVKKYLSNSFADIMKDKKFHNALPGHLIQYGSVYQERVNLVLKRIELIMLS